MQEVGGVPGRLTLSHMEKPWHHQSWLDVKQEVKKKKKKKYSVFHDVTISSEDGLCQQASFSRSPSHFPSFETPQTLFALAKEHLTVPKGIPCSCQECLYASEQDYPSMMLRLIFLNSLVCTQHALFRGSQTLCHQDPLPEPLPTRGRHRLPLRTEHEVT